MTYDPQEGARAYHRNREAYARRNAEIREQVRTWGDVRRVAAEHGLTPQRVSQIAALKEVWSCRTCLKTTRQRITPHQRECVHALADAGRDAARIADCTGIPTRSVQIILLERKVGRAVR